MYMSDSEADEHIGSNEGDLPDDLECPCGLTFSEPCVLEAHMILCRETDYDIDAKQMVLEQADS